MGASRADLEALTMTVGRLQSTLADLQEQITQRDTELASLKALLALRDERLQAAVTALGKRNVPSLRNRLMSAATSPAAIWVALFSLVLCLSWFYRRQQSLPSTRVIERKQRQVLTRMPRSMARARHKITC